MPKTRLNQTSRRWLRDLVALVVDDSQDLAKWKKKQATTDKLLLVLIEKAFPAADMEILRKYNVLDSYNELRFVGPTGHRQMHTFFEFVNLPQHKQYLDIKVSARIESLIEESAKMHVDYKNNATGIRRDYKNLINCARHYEDVLEVWPEAEQLRDRIVTKSTALVSLEVLVRIKRDVAKRKALLKKQAAKEHDESSDS